MLLVGITSIAIVGPFAIVGRLFQRAGHPRFLGIISSSVTRTLFGITVTVDGELALIADDHKPYVYVCNHQGMMDFIAMASVFPARTVILAKKSIVYLPLFGQIYWLVGHYLVDRKKHAQGMQVMAAIAEKVKRDGASVWIFPEGTRNRKGGLLPFKKGAFHLAVQAQGRWCHVSAVADLCRCRLCRLCGLCGLCGLCRAGWFRAECQRAQAIFWLQIRYMMVFAHHDHALARQIEGRIGIAKLRVAIGKALWCATALLLIPLIVLMIGK